MHARAERREGHPLGGTCRHRKARRLGALYLVCARNVGKGATEFIRCSFGEQGKRSIKRSRNGAVVGCAVHAVWAGGRKWGRCGSLRVRFATRTTGDCPQRAPITRREARSGQLGARKLVRGDSGSLLETSRVEERKLASVCVQLGST